MVRSSLAALAIAIVTSVWQAPVVLAPPGDCTWVATADLPSLAEVRSLSELRQLRDRVALESQRCQAAVDLSFFSDAYQPDTLTLKNQNWRRYQKQLEQRYTLEVAAQKSMKSAQKFASKAQQWENRSSSDADTWRAAKTAWQNAANKLEEVPKESFLASQAKEQRKTYRQNYTQATQKLELAQLAEKFILYADTNRDGQLNDEDYVGRQRWQWQQGALVLFNLDDDDGNGRSDWQDRRVNGDKDAADLALVKLRLDRRFQDMKLRMRVDDGARRYVNLFQKTAQGWEYIANDGSQEIKTTPDIWKSAKQKNNMGEIVFGIEAKQFAHKDWNGEISIKAIASQKGNTLTADTVKFRVSPWIVRPNTAPVKSLFVSDWGRLNDRFIKQIQEIVPPTQASVKAVRRGPLWIQDTMEIGYLQFPTLRRSSVQAVSDDKNVTSVPSVLHGNRGANKDNFSRSLLKSNFGWFNIGKPRNLLPGDRWADWYGNLEVTPPLPGYPLGRIYYGNSGTATLHPEVVEFLKAQEIQGPPVDIDTSWLMIRHVDEVISFIPSKNEKPLMLVVSPEAGVNLLRQLQREGHGNKAINRGLSTATTVQGALNNRRLIDHNLQIQRDRIDPLISKLKREFSLNDNQIIQIPAMFSLTGYSWWPNMVNSVAVNGHFLVADPRGPIVGDRDVTQDTFRKLVSKSPLQVHFLDNDYYQELRGNVHCATNTTRTPPEKPFWKQLPDRLKNE